MVLVRMQHGHSVGSQMTKKIVKLHLKKMEEGSNFNFDAVQNRICFLCLISSAFFMNLDDKNLH